MKTTIKLLGIIGLVTMLGFAIASCSSPTGPEPGSLVTQNLTIAGTFDAVNGSGTAKFSATAGSGAKSIMAARAIGSTEFELTGLLEDGDITFRLRGNYNSETKTYTLSAAAETIGLRYSISGKFKDNGTAETGKAVVQVRTGSGESATWSTTEVPVVTQGTAPQMDTSKTPIDDTPGGIPLEWRGIWRDSTDASFYALVNAFSVIIYEKAGSSWVESESLYFTDVKQQDGGYSGITGFMGWDYDKLNQVSAYQWNTNMIMDFAKAKYPGKIPATDAISLRSRYLESLMTGPGGGVDKVKAAFNVYGAAYSNTVWGVNHETAWKYQYSGNVSWENFETDMADFNAEFQAIWQWVIDNHYSDFDEYLATDEYKMKLSALLDKYPSLQAKYQIMLVYVDEWEIVYNDPGIAPRPSDFDTKFQTLITSWANSNGYIVIDYPSLHEEILASGYEDEWLKAKYGKTAPYYVQFYQKMLLRNQNGKLYYGQYYKPAVGGSWSGGFWMPNGPGDIPPVYAVSSFALTSTLTALDIDMTYGLGR